MMQIQMLILNTPSSSEMMPNIQCPPSELPSWVLTIFLDVGTLFHFVETCAIMRLQTCVQ